MKIPRRIAQTLMNALKGGVVPRIGLPYIAVGRKAEIEALLRDVELMEEGGASFRFLVGRYGSGKSFLLQTIRSYVMDRNFVVVDADLSPERRLQGGQGQGLATYRELVRNMSTKTRPEGGALELILDRWISAVQQQVMAEQGLSLEDAALPRLTEQRIAAAVCGLQEMVHGFDFARLLTRYYLAYREGDDEGRGKVLKWFRGEYPNKTEARRELGVNIVISDEDWYDYLKLFAAFLRQAGYAGLLILIDELVNIYKIPHAINRQYNYEKLLTMYNDALQGKARHMGIILCATPQCMEDPRRGVYSYEALRSRLSEGRFTGNRRDLLSPVIRLQPLTVEEMLVLTEKLEEIHAALYGHGSILTQQERMHFLSVEYARVGADSHITPREIIRDFIQVLDIVWQDPTVQVGELLGGEGFTFAANAVAEAPVEQNYAEFTL